MQHTTALDRRMEGRAVLKDLSKIFDYMPQYFINANMIF